MKNINESVGKTGETSQTLNGVIHQIQAAGVLRKTIKGRFDGSCIPGAYSCGEDRTDGGTMVEFMDGIQFLCEQTMRTLQ
jgi:hypothetical protein